MFITKEVQVEIKIPKQLEVSDGDATGCLLDMEYASMYDCDGISCEDCYFCLSTVKAVANVSDK